MHRGREPGGPSCQRSASHGASSKNWHGNRRRAGQSTPRGRGSPRPETREYHDHEIRRQAPGFRAGQARHRRRPRATDGTIAATSAGRHWWAPSSTCRPSSGRQRSLMPAPTSSLSALRCTRCSRANAPSKEEPGQPDRRHPYNEPGPMSAVQPSSGDGRRAALNWVVRRCLAKDPGRPLAIRARPGACSLSARRCASIVWA